MRHCTYFVSLGLYSLYSFSCFDHWSRNISYTANGCGMTLVQDLCTQWLVVPPIPAWLPLGVEMTSPLFGGLVMGSLTRSFKVTGSECWLAKIFKLNLSVFLVPERNCAITIW